MTCPDPLHDHELSALRDERDRLAREVDRLTTIAVKHRLRANNLDTKMGTYGARLKRLLVRTRAANVRIAGERDEAREHRDLLIRRLQNAQETIASLRAGERIDP